MCASMKYYGNTCCVEFFSESQMLYTSYIFLFHDEIIQISEFNVKETATDPTDHIQFEFFSHESIRTNLMSPRLKRTHK